MGIPVWLARSDEPDTPAALPRVRLSAGTGDWLLVSRGPVPERWAKLMADITAAIDPARCCFGQWADNDVAGTAIDEVDQRGIRWLLSFGAPPVCVDHPGVLVAPELEILARDAQARRALWEILERKL